MNAGQRRRFDVLLEEVLAGMPDQVHELLEEVPLLVEDHPSDDVLEQMGIAFREDLCGLHDGIALTERSVEHDAHLPHTISIYREGIISLSIEEAGGWSDEEIAHQIQVTILHEIGHHFGLDEDDLERLGYG